MNYTEEILRAFSIGLLVGKFLFNTGHYQKAIELFKECLVLLNNKVVRMQELYYLHIYKSLASACQRTGDPRQAIEYCEKTRAVLQHLNEREAEGRVCGMLANQYQSLGDYVKAKELHNEALAISIETGDKEGEGVHCGELGALYMSLSEYMKAKEFNEKALAISIEIGNRVQQGIQCGNLGTVFQSLGDCMMAKEFFESALAISIEIGDRKTEETNNGNLGSLYQSLGKYVKAIEFYEKALAISKEIGDRKGEGTQYGNLGTVYRSLGDYLNAKEFIGKALAISIEIGDRKRQGVHYGYLGFVFWSLGEYKKSKEFHEKALAISIEIGDKKRQVSDRGNLGTVYQSLGDYDKAKQLYEEALAISIKIGDRKGEGTEYGNIGTVYQFFGEYVKAKEFHAKALAIRIEIGDREGEGIDYGNLGSVYRSLGEYVTAKESHEKALAISIEIGNRKGEGVQYGELGQVYSSLGDNMKAKEFHEKALTISIEIGFKEMQAANYGNLGILYRTLGDYDNAKVLFEKALAISVEVGDRQGEGTWYVNLGTLCHFGGYNGVAEEYYKKGLEVLSELGSVQGEGLCHFHLACLYYVMMKSKEALSCLSSAFQSFEDLRSFLGDHDQYKINFADKQKFNYNLLVLMLSKRREIIDALLVSELGRARALADLVSAQYSLQGVRSNSQLALIDIEQIMSNEELTVTGLYISFILRNIYFWIVKANNKVLFQEIDEDAFGALYDCHDLSSQDSVELLVNQNFKELRVLLEGDYEDRSLSTFYETDVQYQPQNEAKLTCCRLAEEDKEEQEQETALRSLYKMIISPVADLLEGSEIIICPEPLLYQVPFAALLDEDERYLSEKFRIRLIPSLTTLKLIQDSPADYHSQTGALIVGDPDVGRLDICRLPGAKKEAEMIGKLLHVQPLIGREATKQAVLQSMRSVSLIHIAAHGDAKRGEIALAPLRPINRTPQKEDFMLTMSDVSEVQLRAKLVVLSCCHSGRGEVRSEGVIGIARAYLGSGARSVLVSLWAVDDTATKEFMCQFYEHLSRGESASECLHEAMKWMRGRPQYCAVLKWAPFMLIGDNVTFNFEELTRDQWSNSTRVA